MGILYKKWQQYSYVARKHQRRRFIGVIVALLSFFIFYIVLHSFVIFSVEIESSSMMPALERGDRCLVLPIALFPKEVDHSWFPIHRGDLVVLEKQWGEKEPPWFMKLYGSLVSFFTAQRIDPLASYRSRMVKRVIALPGDKIMMEEYLFKVQPAGKTYTFTEFEVARDSYTLTIPDKNPLWDRTLPYSGSMDGLTVPEGRIFVASDDRSSIQDSRSWGTISIAAVSGRLVFRYWPVSRFGPLP
ncbi:MAG: signal peptidase I [Treponemataceae bacterium]|nr:signal peptidase I [Treponemataceae bacterium]